LKGTHAADAFRLGPKSCEYKKVNTWLNAISLFDEKHRRERLVQCSNLSLFQKRHFCATDAPRKGEEATSMTFIKPLNLIAVGATFVFLGAIVLGVL
jgi:hypothetical protein